ncbi:MAG TPA: ATP-binding protein [Polyangiaceae bacterium]|nr:ATP-binding protein [Polyangiaceae bacterium]
MAPDSLTSGEAAPDEAARLRAVHQLELLDTPPEERFDRITRLAAQTLHTPIALVTLVDRERVWVKSRHGSRIREIARLGSFCSETLAHDEEFSVPDALADPRFCEHELVRSEPHVRFYAGRSLRSSNGFRVGTLCILDRVPRRLTPDQGRALADLAFLIERELALGDRMRLKNEFVATVSHELRTPLTSIRGSLGLLLGEALGRLPEPVQSMLQIAHSNSERLMRIVNDLLDIDKIEAGKLDFVLSRASLQPILERSLIENGELARARGVEFRLHMGAADACARIDPDRLLQVLTNLLSNAVKFSPPGAAVELELEPRSEQVRIAVKDHGPGIPHEFRARMFGKFAQADASDARSRGGSGLGLNIARALTERMGGQIGFTSELGLGSTFFVDLPRCGALDHEHSIFLPRVLVCEADLDTARTLAIDLEAHGFIADLVSDPSAVQRALRDRSYSALTLDLRLPESSEVLRTLRDDPRTRDLAVVVVSADVTDAASQRAAVGLEIAGWLEKPFGPGELVRQLRAALARREHGAPRLTA